MFRAEKASVAILVLALAVIVSFPQANTVADQPDVVELLRHDQRTRTVTFTSKQAPSGGSPAETGGSDGQTAQPDAKDILKMDVDQLAQLDVVAPDLQTVVSTVTRHESSVGRSPAAVYVITCDMIRRAGARTIPDMLRLVPGLHVARLDANKWAISSRGFTDRFADKLLVQIDGRTVYTPLFSGVYWDIPDVLLEDIERIEVIRGPGASVWGANAVNGIINIITKKSSETQGAFLEAGAGTEERGFAGARYGGKINDKTTFRIYGKWFERDGGYLAPGSSPFAPHEPDDWRQARTGFRLDSQPDECNFLTLQGDYYDGYSGEGIGLPGSFPPSFRQYIRGDTHVEGGNILTRWSHTIDEDSDWSAQLYYDRTERHSTTYSFFEDRDIFDFDFQHRFPLGHRHSITWGFGYRYTEDYIGNQPFYLGFDPAQRADDLFSYFIQDDIEIVRKKLYFLVGSKFEHNDYSGFEYQPTGRVVWQPNVRTAIWGAVSRAVRSPSRADSDLRLTTLYSIGPGPLPQFALVEGNPDFESESVISYEIGLRRQPRKEFYWDIAVFYNNYDDVRAYLPFAAYLGTTPGGWPAVFIPVTFANGVEAETYGFEWVGSYDLNACWTVRGGYSFLRANVEPAPGMLATVEESSGPRNMFFLWLSGRPLRRWETDFILRYVDNVPAPNVESYCVGDIRLAYELRNGAEIFVVGRNLFDAAHREWSRGDILEITGTEVQTEVFGGLAIRH